MANNKNLDKSLQSGDPCDVKTIIQRKLVRTTTLATALSLLIPAMPCLAHADDLLFGGAAGAGMAGAGLALPAYVARNNLLNPALLGFARHELVLNWPSFGYHTDGISVNELRDQFGSLNNAGLSNSKLQSFAITDGDGVKQFGLNAGVGLLASGFALNGLGEANVTTIPNAALQTWSKNGGSTSDPTILQGQLDAYGLAYVQESLGYGDILKTKGGTDGDRLSLGASVKVIQAFYSHKIINGYTESGNSVSSSAADGLDITENGGSNNVQKHGAGLDVGAIYSSAKMKQLYYGVVVEIAIEPNIKFDRQLPGNPGAPGAVRSDDIDIFKRAFDAGVGWVANSKVHVAADFIDIGNSADREELRTGVDYSILLGFSARAGYSSYSGVDFGISYKGFAVGYSPRTRLTVGTSYRF